MLFNSIEFLLFLVAVYILYWFAFPKNIRLQNFLLLLAGYLFYGWWDWRFLILIVFSSAVDYFASLGMENGASDSRRRLLLWTSIVVNIGTLGFFKYFNFFAESFAEAFTFFGLPISADRLDIILPVGISFYTFQSLSYTIDVYRKKIDASRDPVAFFAYVNFFPQLVAGPIERAAHLLPQFHKARVFTMKAMSSGMKLMIQGFFLKLVVADRAAIYADAVFNNVDAHGGITFLAGTLAFAFQIYGDFAGYSLIAIGTARLFGFDLMQNFRRPYFARSVTEFWQRWHISLSTWFRDYLYIPLGGNRVGRARWYFNLFITFVISGLWHGANWTFVAWGALNGVFIIIETLFKEKKAHPIPGMLLTFVLINFTWIFFRANSMHDAQHILQSIFTNPGRLFLGEGGEAINSIVYMLGGISLLWIAECKKEFFPGSFSLRQHRSEYVRMTSYALIVFLIFYVGVLSGGQFIYFQF